MVWNSQSSICSSALSFSANTPIPSISLRLRAKSTSLTASNGNACTVPSEWLFQKANSVPLAFENSHSDGALWMEISAATCNNSGASCQRQAIPGVVRSCPRIRQRRLRPEEGCAGSDLQRGERANCRCCLCQKSGGPGGQAANDQDSANEPEL